MKLTLEIGDDFDFSLLGISCHAKDYRLCWELNNALGIKFKKSEAIYPMKRKEDGGIGFPIHSFDDDENQLSYTLISNKFEGNVLVQEHPEFDFILKLSGSQHEYEIKYKKQLIQHIDIVLAVIQMETKKLKSKPKLVF